VTLMTMAIVLAQNSPDPSTKHGCIVINDDFTILSAGYNGAPRKSKNANIPLTRPEKYPYMKHSEGNAISNAAREGISLKEGTAIVSGHPCDGCFGDMIQAGIKRIIYGPIGSHMVDDETLERIKNMNEDESGNEIIDISPMTEYLTGSLNEEVRPLRNDDIYDMLARTIKYVDMKLKDQ